MSNSRCTSPESAGWPRLDLCAGDYAAHRKTPRSALKGDSSRDTVVPAPVLRAQVNKPKQEGHLTPLQNCVEKCQGYSRGADRPQFNRGEAIEQPRLNHKEVPC